MIDFVCSQKDLKEAVAKAVKAVPAKPQLLVLENLKIDTQTGGNIVAFTGYDLTTGIISRTEAKTVHEFGELLVNAKLFSSIVKKLPKGDVRIYSDEHLKLTIEQGSIVFNLPAIDVENYPEIERVHSKVQSFTISQPALQSMLAETLYARSQSDAKPILKGEYFEVIDSRLSLTAIDGFRCAIRREPVQNEYDFSFTVDGDALEKISGLLSADTSSTVTVEFQKNHVLFRLEKGADCTVITRLLPGEFFNYKTAIPKKISLSAHFDVPDLIETLERAYVLCAATLNCVKLRFDTGANELEINFDTAKGHFTETLTIEAEGESTEIGFNIRFLIEALKAIPGELAEMKLNGQLNPMMITPLAGDNYAHILLPVRLK